MDQMPLRQVRRKVDEWQPQEVSVRSGRASYDTVVYACLHVCMVRI